MEDGIIDLRSDAVTRPTEAMWEAQRRANLGWACAGEDRSVNELQSLAAELSGKEASLFVLTGTMANLIALMTHTERGDQIVLEASSHILWSEEWSFAHICGLVPRVIEGVDGSMSPGAVERAISDQKFNHKPRTRLICLENTHNMAGGTIVSRDDISAVSAIARENKVSIHLDGARILNASVALQERLDTMVAEVDSLTINLNKGLSAPAGALLCGSASFIERSRLNQKRLGGWSLHQAGILAAAGVVALKSMIPQLAEDNKRAGLLNLGLGTLDNATIKMKPVQTNIVVLSVNSSTMSASSIVAQLKEHHILATLLSENEIRFVTHRHINDEDIDQVVGTVGNIVKGHNSIT